MTPMASHTDSVTTRQRIVVHGIVQGVGFRPFVYRLARQLGISGSVHNTGGQVIVDAEGSCDQLDALIHALRTAAPPLAHVTDVEAELLVPRGARGFHIAASEPGLRLPVVPADIATCADCLAEVFDPADRRYRYPFTNCTSCGPRFSIITALPYDRAKTTMARFTMCAQCRQEYETPADRRFHAQPNACRDCGPQLTLTDAAGRTLACEDDALHAAAGALRQGRIVAVKGIGGFHLMVDATSEDAVVRLRRRKHRPAKPLALMVRDKAMAFETIKYGPVTDAALSSPQAPIVLAPRAAGAAVAPSVAPANPELGVMLAYTPLHHLLLTPLHGPVVATSGNRADEPICTDNTEALARLGEIADLFLVHDRPIARPVDDSVVRVMAPRARVLRRARGYAPMPIALPKGHHRDGVLAVGGHLKATVALGVGGHAVLSQHLGDLETPEALAAYESVATDLPTFFDTRPRRLICDAHPDYRSTRWAHAVGKPVAHVQHHVAHVLSCMAEHGLPPDHPVLGVAWDGTGYGPDGTVWGGEWFHLRNGAAQRVATLRAFRLPGGEKAVREPWRAAAGVLHELEATDAPMAPFEHLARAATEPQRRVVQTMLRRGLNAPLTTSAGRLFDAGAALLGIAHESRFEGEAAMALEAAAAGVANDEGGAYPLELRDDRHLTLDWAPAITALLADWAHGTSPGVCAVRLHRGLIDAIVSVAQWVGEADVVLSGGCFQNRILVEGAERTLRAAGFRVWLHERVPPNDGGLALGQLYANDEMLKGALACV